MRLTRTLTPAILLLTGCYFSQGIGVKPSAYQLTPDMRKYADEMSLARDAFEADAIPYDRLGTVTKQYEHEVNWLLLWVGADWFGRLEDGYVYEASRIFYPLLGRTERYRYSPDGVRTASYGNALFGILLPIPHVTVVGLGYERSRDDTKGEGHTDIALQILTLPLVNTSLLAIGTAGFDFLFLPLWRKDRNPPPEKLEKPLPDSPEKA